jgi:hypothetical protein
MKPSATFEPDDSTAPLCSYHLKRQACVFNDTEVRPDVKAQDVKQKIQSAFQRQASLDAKDIKVNVDGSAVILQGTVHSWREKDDAAIAAWAAPGVTKSKTNSKCNSDNLARRESDRNDCSRDDLFLPVVRIINVPRPGHGEVGTSYWRQVNCAR